MEKLIDLAEKDLPDWYKRTVTGTREAYNSLPPNWKEITAAEFAGSDFFVYGFSHYEYRQVHDGQKFLGGIRMFYISNRPEGFAMINRYDGKTGKHAVQYFRFAACVHKWESVNRSRMAELTKKFPALQGKGTWGNCCTNNVCSKCGDYHFIDSSD